MDLFASALRKGLVTGDDIIKINNDKLRNKFNKTFIKKALYDSLFVKYDSETSTLSISSFCLYFSILFYVISLFLYCTFYDMNSSILNLFILFIKDFFFIGLTYSFGNFIINFLFYNKKNKVCNKKIQ